MDSEREDSYQLFLATLTESIRAQRQILSVLGELKSEMSEIRSSLGAPAATAEPTAPAPGRATSQDASRALARTAPDPPARERPEDQPEEALPVSDEIPVLDVMVNVDGSPVQIEKAPRRHLTLVD